MLLNELNLKLKELEKERETTLNPLIKKEEEIKERWTNTLKELCSTDANINIHILYDASISIELLDEVNKKPIFGTEISMYIWYKYSADKIKLEINTGTCGAFDKDNFGQINKYMTMNNLVQNMDKLEKLFIEDLELLKPLRQDDRKIEKQLEDIAYEIKCEESRIEREEFVKTIDYEALYYCDNWSFRREYFNGYAYVKYVKDTANNTIIEVGCYYPEHKKFVPCKTKRMNKDLFLNCIKNKTITVKED